MHLKIIKFVKFALDFLIFLWKFFFFLILFKGLISIKTRHTSNIFNAKFLPESDNKKLVSCSSNGGLFYTNIEKSVEEPVVHEFKCHGNKTCFKVCFL